MSAERRVTRRDLLFPRCPAPTPSTPGIAVIQVWKCLAHTGSFCTVCHERCPESGCITLDQGRPRIDPARCTGCTLCVEACPAPDPAILLVPRRRAP